MGKGCRVLGFPLVLGLQSDLDTHSRHGIHHLLPGCTSQGADDQAVVSTRNVQGTWEVVPAPPGDGYDVHHMRRHLLVYVPPKWNILPFASSNAGDMWF